RSLPMYLATRHTVSRRAHFVARLAAAIRRTVAVRGGFGMFDIVPLPYLWASRMPRSAPFFQGGQLSSPPVSSFSNQVFQLLTPSTLQVTHNEFNPHRSYRLQWNLNIQRQLTRSMALT